METAHAGQGGQSSFLRRVRWLSNRDSPLLLLLLAAIPYFVGLGDSSVWDANEAFYTETPREMIEAGDYVNPSFNYLPRFNKPVLNYWVVAGFYKVFGISVATERIPIALSAIVLMATAFGLARALRSTRAGVWAAIAIAASPRVLMFARRIFIDMWVTMFMGLVLLFFFLSQRYPEKRTRYLLLMYAATGLGMLTKGPVALVLPAMVFVIWLAVQRRLRDVWTMHLPIGAAIVLAIVAPWYIALYFQHGWEHIVGFLWGENVARYADAVAPRRGLLFYPPVVFGDLFPWSLTLIPAAALAWRSRRAATPERLRMLLWLWIIVIVGFFSLSATKQDLYIFPIVVAVAALAGEVLDGCGEVRGLTRWTIAMAGLAVLALAIFIQRLFGGSGHIYQLAGVTPIVLTAGLCGAVAAALAFARRVFAAQVVLAACVITLNWVFVLETLPSFERYKPVKPMSELIDSRAGRDAVLLHYEVALPSMVFYVRRHVEQIFVDPEPLFEKMRTAREYYLVLRATEYEKLRPAFPGPSCVIDRRPLFEVKLKDVLARQPLPELLLVTNRCP
jgi:4-amino-4-deoxy-L-arabinose transferase-like glycosyltransferase